MNETIVTQWLVFRVRRGHTGNARVQQRHESGVSRHPVRYDAASKGAGSGGVVSPGLTQSWGISLTSACVMTLCDSCARMKRVRGTLNVVAIATPARAPIDDNATSLRLA
jgi:hypothetical protein